MSQGVQIIKMNGAFCLPMCHIKSMVASAAEAEAELRALFFNCKEGKILRLTFTELSHPQSPTLVHCNCNNATVSGIANSSVKNSVYNQWKWFLGVVRPSQS